MKKFYSKFFWPVLTCFLTLLFFLANLVNGRTPIPADSVLGLYHPWRDTQIENYQPGKFPTKNPLITDPVLQTYPWRKLTIDNIKNWSPPLWNPYSFSGQPLLANIQSAPFQILNMCFLILPFKIAWTIQIIMPAILSSLFMFLFLKSLKLKDFAASYGGFILPLSGFFIAWQTWGTVITTAMWLPAILFAINKLYQKPGIFWFIFLIFSFSQTILSGHWQTAFYVIGASILYLVYLNFKYKNYKIFFLTLFSLFISILICAPQLIPSLEFIKYSARELDQNYYIGRKDWFLPLQNLIQLIAPDFFGNPVTYNYWGVWNYAEFVSYIGIIPLLLALNAIFNKFKKNYFFILLASATLFLVLENPISKIPYLFNFPLYDSLQPSRIIFLLDFALVVLSAYGFEHFINGKKSLKSFIPFSLIALILGSLAFFVKTYGNILPVTEKINSQSVALHNLIFPSGILFLFILPFLLSYKKANKIAVIGIVFTITIFELFRFGQKFTPFSKLSWIFPETKVTTYLENQQKPFRVLATDRRIMNGNASSIYKIETVQGYDPIYLKDYAQLVSSWDSGKLTDPGSFNRIVTPQKFDSKITDLLNVQYIMSFDEIRKPGFTKVLVEGDTKLYKNENVLPRAFFADEVEKVQSKNQELENLLKSTNSKKAVYSSQFSFPKTENSGKVEIKNYQDQSFDLITASDKESPLIVSNTYYPGWKAYIDGQKTTINRVDFLVQSIIVPAGVHNISFNFQPDSFYNSLYLCAFGIILSILTAIIIWKKRFL